MRTSVVVRLHKKFSRKKMRAVNSVELTSEPHMDFISIGYRIAIRGKDGYYLTNFLEIDGGFADDLNLEQSAFFD